MGNLFDGLQKAVVKTVQKSMGYTASWQPAVGGEIITATVLFKDATERAKILYAEFDPRKIIMEFQIGDFDDLITKVRKNNTEEVVTINDQDYGVLQVISKFDGNTFYAELQEL